MSSTTAFLQSLKMAQLGGQTTLATPPELEHQFDAARRWRFDIAWPAALVAVEIEGMKRGRYGRHQRQTGYHKDCEKYNAAALLGWCVLRYTSQDLYNDPLGMFQQIQQVIERRQATQGGVSHGAEQ